MKLKIESHKYAPELNRVYLTGKNSSRAAVLRAPAVTSVNEARAALFPKPIPFRRVVTVEAYYNDPRFAGLNRRYSGVVDSYEHLKNVIANIKARNTGGPLLDGSILPPVNVRVISLKAVGV